jgi:hypothetical protein
VPLLFFGLLFFVLPEAVNIFTVLTAKNIGITNNKTIRNQRSVEELTLMLFTSSIKKRKMVLLIVRKIKKKQYTDPIKATNLKNL